MIHRAKAPLRIGLAGGGTDLSPYTELYGGLVVNATINLFAHAEIRTVTEPGLVIQLKEPHIAIAYSPGQIIPAEGPFDLAIGVYNRIIRDYGPLHHGISLRYHADAPLGSGLGTSSTTVVAITAAFFSLLGLPADPSTIAGYAYDIERNDLGFAGGRQDQYAAAYGGINLMEFSRTQAAKVTPLNLPMEVITLLEKNLLLYYTAKSREAWQIIEEQQQNVREGRPAPVEAMHALKLQAGQLAESLRQGNTDAVGPLLDKGFRNKVQMARHISNPFLDTLYAAALAAGATGGKISGAGGGGYMIFYCPDGTRERVTEVLLRFGGQVQPYSFTREGVMAWKESYEKENYRDHQ